MLKKIFVVSCLVWLVSLAACDRAPQPPLVIGIQSWPGFESLRLARELGFFTGFNLQLADHADAAALEQALLERRIQLATITLDEALLLRRDMPDLKIILLFAAAKGTEKRTDVLVARDEAVGAYHRELRQLLAGWAQAMEYLDKEPQQARQIMARQENVPAAQFEQRLQSLELYGLRRNQQLLLGEPPPFGREIVEAQRGLIARGKLSMGADPAVLVDATLLAEAVKQ